LIVDMSEVTLAHTFLLYNLNKSMLMNWLFFAT